ncbi:MAG: signal peptidase II [Pseudomonadota bacterium]
MSLLHRFLLVAPVLALSILFDQVTKAVAGSTLSPLISTAYLDGVLKFIYTENTGIMFSIGIGLPDTLKYGLFTLLPSLLFVVFLVTIFVRQEMSRLALIACSLIIGGGMSNVIDRLVNDGAVIDFIYLDLWGRLTGIFNIADVAISAGSAVLLIHTLVRLAKVKLGAQDQFLDRV